MSRKIKDQGKLRRWAGRQRQKLTDDYTGLPVYSDKVKYDYQGFIVSAEPKSLPDPKPIPEYELDIPAETSPDFVRTPGPYILDPVSAAWELFWDTADFDWDDNEYEY